MRIDVDELKTNHVSYSSKNDSLLINIYNYFTAIIITGGMMTFVTSALRQ